MVSNASVAFQSIFITEDVIKKKNNLEKRLVKSFSKSDS